MRYQTKENLIVSSILGGLIIVVILGIAGLSKWQCASRWKLSGMETSWGPIQGCQVKTSKGWRPEDRVRETDIEGEGN